MATRYFKSTHNGITIFRASETRAYRFGVFGGRYGDGFSEKAGNAPAVEITKAEYEELIDRKNARLRRQGRDPRYAGPSSSWVPADDAAA